MAENRLPIINWKGLQTLNCPVRTAPKEKPMENPWDKSAPNYNRMARMEAEATTAILNTFPTEPTDTVLDCGCGPGRITVQMAGKAKSVTAMDSADNMLRHCKKYCEDEGRTNVNFLKLDFFDAQVGRDFDPFDIVICSRSAGFADLPKLISFSKKLVVLQAFANSPSLPELFGRLFTGCHEENRDYSNYTKDRRLEYNITFNYLYDMGYEPNVLLMPDYFKCVKNSKEDIYDHIRPLGKVAEGKEGVFRKNLEPHITANADGTYTFLAETRASLIWFEVHPRKFF